MLWAVSFLGVSVLNPEIQHANLDIQCVNPDI